MIIKLFTSYECTYGYCSTKNNVPQVMTVQAKLDINNFPISCAILLILSQGIAYDVSFFGNCYSPQSLVENIRTLISI